MTVTKGRRRVSLDLPEEVVDWFYSEYPGGSLTWLVSLLLSAYKESHRETPKELSTFVALDLLHSLRSKYD